MVTAEAIRGGTEDRVEDLRLTLAHLVFDQQAADRSMGIPAIMPPDLFAWYRTTPDYSAQCAATINFHCRPQQDGSLQEHRQYLIGDTFERIAWYIVRWQLREGEILLSPERTFQLYRVLFPGKPVIYNTIGKPTLDGISVPDAVAVADGRITLVYEMTMATQDMLATHIGRTRWAIKRDTKRFTQFFEGAQLVVVVPFDTTIPAGVDDRIGIQGLPQVTHELVTRFVDRWYGYVCDDPGSATLYDMQNRAKKQHERGRALREAGALPPPYGQALERWEQELLNPRP